MMKNIAGAAFATVQDYPSLAAGSCAFIIAFALVAGNALLSQPGGHPDPLWATRDQVTTRSVAARLDQIPVRKVKIETVVPAEIPVPVLRPNSPGTEMPVPVSVRDAQQGLKELGIYSGEVDGFYGPMTRAAILRFEKAHHLGNDGEVTARLIAAIGAETGGAVQRPAAQDATLAPSASDPPLRAEPASLSEPDGPPADSMADITRAARIARIQIGLMNFGEQGIAVDGVLGPQTVTSIQTFQRRYHLPVTGEPDEAVIDKLEQIGALKKS
jgi:Putative peptidoglycan binding domain